MLFLKVGCFSRNLKNSRWLSQLNREKNVLFLLERDKEKEKTSSQAPSPPCWWKCVYVWVSVCMCVCVCFFVPIVGEAEATRLEALIQYVTLFRLCIWDTSVCDKSSFFVSSPPLFSFTPLVCSSPPPLAFLPTLSLSFPPIPLQHTSKERKKLVHSWFGKKKVE